MGSLEDCQLLTVARKYFDETEGQKQVMELVVEHGGSLHVEFRQLAQPGEGHGEEVLGVSLCRSFDMRLSSRTAFRSISSSPRASCCIRTAWWSSGRVFATVLSSLELLNTLYLNFATISQLELLFNRKSQSVKGSIFDTINRTVTLGGKQMLRSWLLSPSSEEVRNKHRWYPGYNQWTTGCSRWVYF